MVLYRVFLRKLCFVAAGSLLGFRRSEVDFLRHHTVQALVRTVLVLARVLGGYWGPENHLR